MGFIQLSIITLRWGVVCVGVWCCALWRFCVVLFADGMRMDVLIGLIVFEFDYCVVMG